MIANRWKKMIRLHVLWTAAILAVLPGAATAADAYGYTATSAVPFSYLNIAATGAATLANSDDATATIALPFGFRFYGTTYTSLCVSTNGLIAFGGCVANDFTNLDLTAQSPPGNLPLIAPFWMDLTFAVPGAGSVVYQTLGTAGLRQFVVQWNNALGLNMPGTLNFQVVLSEGSNNILFQYLSVETGSQQVSKGASATVGIRGVSGQANGYRLQWSYRAPVLSNRLAIRFTAPAGAAPVEVSASVKVTTSAFVYYRTTQTYRGTITVANTSKSPIKLPLSVVLTKLTPGVTALNAAGTLPGQGPYYIVPGTTSLASGKSVQVAVEFKNPSNAKIAFVAKTYSGAF